MSNVKRTSRVSPVIFRNICIKCCLGLNIVTIRIEPVPFSASNISNILLKKNTRKTLKECIERSLETYTYHVYCLLSSGFSHTAITVQQRKKWKIEFHDYSEMIKLFVGRASIRRMKSNSLKSVELRMQDAGYYAFPHMLFVQSFYTS